MPGTVLLSLCSVSKLWTATRVQRATSLQRQRVGRCPPPDCPGPGLLLPAFLAPIQCQANIIPPSCVNGQHLLVDVVQRYLSTSNCDTLSALFSDF
ncbi:hypothetical protein B0T09DRAFT_167343 [Sordaria sp. MPI-SDFR-AT-0083]|nr:hypothetical protein B0T09DRAFT_167343 [Sordaria sp. MPI-SDFR-AT-0083]